MFKILSVKFKTTERISCNKYTEYQSNQWNIKNWDKEILDAWRRYGEINYT
jgi:hypothetical protein